MLFRSGETIVFAGDSITDAGRTTGESGELGSGYVAILHSLLLTLRPQLRIRVVNEGVSGDTVLDLEKRWSEVLAHKPDWLVMLIGINDYWRTRSESEREGVSAAEYEDAYRRLLEQAEETGAGLILMEPFLVDRDIRGRDRQGLKPYSTAVAKLAGETGAVFVPLQIEFDRAMATRAPEFWSEDRVHPTVAGHALIAGKLLTALQCCEEAASSAA